MTFFGQLAERWREQSAAKKFTRGTLHGKQGSDEPPEANLHLSKPSCNIVASHSGPDSGVAVYKQFAQDLPASWDNPVDWAYGISVSMYDLGPTGRRNGEPVADCFGILAYPEGAILAVADGVNWGEPPRRAARCAVLGSLNHMHQALKKHESNHALDTHTVFRHLVESIQTSQKLILQQFGTLTTLVVSVVLPLKWVRQPGRWVAITMTVGDSAAYVYRAASRRVEEVTAAAHADGARDPRWCPGALGYAMGEDPDLANMLLCLTFLDEGDFIFLTSDGVADNFDPVIRKMARHQVLESAENDLPALSPAECQAKAMDLLREVVADADSRCSSTAASPTCGGQRPGLTARALAEQLLQHVYEVTQEQREHVEARNREREAAMGLLTTANASTATNASSSAAATGPSSALSSGSLPSSTSSSRAPAEAGAAGAGAGASLSTDGRGLMGLAPQSRPPGKMDHATVAAYQVGRRRPDSVVHSSAPSDPLQFPFLAAQAAPQAARYIQQPATNCGNTSHGNNASSSKSGQGTGSAAGQNGTKA